MDDFHRMYPPHTYMRCRFDRPSRGMIIEHRRIARRRLARATAAADIFEWSCDANDEWLRRARLARIHQYRRDHRPPPPPAPEPGFGILAHALKAASP